MEPHFSWLGNHGINLGLLEESCQCEWCQLSRPFFGGPGSPVIPSNIQGQGLKIKFGHACPGLLFRVLMFCGEESRSERGTLESTGRVGFVHFSFRRSQSPCYLTFDIHSFCRVLCFGHGLWLGVAWSLSSIPNWGNWTPKNIGRKGCTLSIPDNCFQDNL